MAHGYTTQGSWFVDPRGRHTLLRGVNFGGSTKVPARPHGATHHGVDFDGWREVSFLGRPAPLDAVDEHLDRIAHWGFNVVRLLVTWEAIEHEGPGIYDEEYLQYVTEVARRAGERGLLVFIDPHQDCWSRWTGGDGAPYWTFALAGLRPDRFVAAEQVRLNDFDWPANNLRVPAATMWTLFFCGDLLCPALRGVQQELQDRYLAAIVALAERVKSFDHVLGYDTLNEPSSGYIGKSSRLRVGTRFMQREQFDAAPWSPLEYLAAAEGHTIKRDGQTLNGEGVSIWQDHCPWQEAGVWDIDSAGVPALVNPNYFKESNGAPVSAWTHGMVPFIHRFRDHLRSVHPDCLVFIEGEPLERDLCWDDPDPLVVNARHWYDVLTLATRQFDPEEYHSLSGRTVSGVDAIGAELSEQLGAFAAHSRTDMSDRPLLLGEFGIPYEMNDGAAYATGEYDAQAVALEANYRGLDDHFIHGTQWNYTADNSHEHGDQWNREDLSIFSPDDQHRNEGPHWLDAGGRAVAGFCRPHVRHAAGRPTGFRFDPRSGEATLVLEADPSIDAPTEVYVPTIHYPTGVTVAVSTGTATHDPEAQRLVWHHPRATGEISLVMRRGS